jgi:transmembrane sensor
MDKMIDEKIWNLMSKRLDKESTAAEEAELSEWLNSNPENPGIFEEVKKAWFLSGSDIINYSPDIEKGWKKVKLEIGKYKVINEKKNKEISSGVFPKIWRIAAILLICISAYVIYSTVFVEKKQDGMKIAQSYSTITKFQLPDGTEVWLNAGSKLEYPENFSTDSRKVNLSGEAFFDVFKDSSKPFIISAARSEVKVLGTSFVYRAVASEDKDVVIVNSGKVLFRQKGSTPKSLTLEQGDKGEINFKSNIVNKTANEDENYFAWKTGRLIYEDETVEKIISGLSKYYNRKIRIENQKLGETRLTVTFDNLKIEESVKIIELLVNVQAKYTDDSIILK